MALWHWLLTSFLGFSYLEHISFITNNFPRMWLMLDQFLWGHSWCDISFSKLTVSKNSFRTLSQCQTIWIQIWTNILLVLIWVRTVCKDYHQMTKVRALTRILKTGVQDSHLAKSRSPTGKSGSPTPKKLESHQFVHCVYLFHFSGKWYLWIIFR